MNKKFPSGTWIEREIFESKAFLNLSGFAPQLLILLFAKRSFQRHGRKGKEKLICMNSDSISFSYKEAKRKYGISQPKLTRAFDQLLAKGFIEIKHAGGAYKQDKAIYGLSDKWRLWSPGIIFETRTRDKVSRGFCKLKLTDAEYKEIFGSEAK